MTDCVTIALPSKGAIAEPTWNFLYKCGLQVEKSNQRQYTGSMPAIPGVNVLFQRVKDVAYKVADGTAQIGITGIDIVKEYHPNDDLILVHPALEYGHCNLVVAVPESWIDVENIMDLADVALDFREYKHRNLRVATSFTNLTRQFLHANGIHHFTLVEAEGAIEAAPTIGYADLIVDLTQTGTSLRDNHLKILSDGLIIESQACLIGNRQALRGNPVVLDTARIMLEYIDATLNGRSYYHVTVNIQGDTSESVAQKVAGSPLTCGLQGPTVSPIHTPNTTGLENRQWYTVSIIVSNNDLLKAVEYLRQIGGTQVVATPARYVFLEQSPSFEVLLQSL